MVQAFRRDKNNDVMKDLRLRGLDPTATYEVTDLDAGALEHRFRQRLDAEGSTCRNCREARGGDHCV